MDDYAPKGIDKLWQWLEYLPLSEHIGITWWFPLLESIHVVAITLLVGTIITVDLRLLGVSALDYAAKRIVKELTPWTWGAFALSVPTGLGMFITRAGHYAGNPAFQIKLLMLVLAGANMAVFHLRSVRGIEEWGKGAQMPGRARAAGALSLVLWTAAIIAGRWTGHLN